MLTLAESVYLLEHMKKDMEQHIKTIDLIKVGLELRQCKAGSLLEDSFR